MLQLRLGINWRQNRDEMLRLLSRDVADCAGNRILLVPEQTSHDYERRLCSRAGDTASRYAEVLSFTRLAGRVFARMGGGAEPTLDGGGRILAMAAAAEELRAGLKAYAAVGARPEFLSELVAAVDEFKSCRVTPESLRAAAERTEGVLPEKLRELSLLLEAYDGICAGFGRDPRDRMTKLLEQMEAGEFAREHVFYIDGFSDFTGQELAILGHLIACSPQVTVSLVCDGPGSQTAGMELAGETAGALLQLAARAGIPAEKICLPDAEESSPLGRMRRGLLAGPPAQIPGLELCARTVRLESVRQECVFAAAEIRRWTQAGGRYRDVALVCADLPRYEPVLRQVLDRYGIPAYFAGREDILCKPVPDAILTALEAVCDGLDRGPVLRYLKSVLSPLAPAACDRLENYAVAWGLRGRSWGEDFTRHPRGLGLSWEPEDEAELAELNRSRIAGVMPLVRLQKALGAAGTVLEQLQAVYAFLEEVQAARRLEELAAAFEAAGDRRSAQEQEQLWEILIGAMEQMAALLGSRVRDLDGFVRLFRLLLSQYQVGTIPQTLDSVTVGGVAAMRRQEARRVYLLGAQEGFLPQAGAGGMVLTEPERRRLMDLGLPLTADLYRQLEQETAGIYAVAAGAGGFFCMTCGDGQPAAAFRRLARMLGRQAEPEALPPEDRVADVWDAGAGLARQDQAPPQAEEAWRQVRAGARYALGRLTPETIRGLYGDRLQLSASQIDRAASCRFAYFMQYGLRARERKEITVDPAEFGTFVHDVLEHTARDVCRAGGFSRVSLERTQAMAEEHARRYCRERFSGLARTSRQDYLLERNMRELQAVVRELWEELAQSQFQPAGFEVRFGPGGAMPAVEIPGGAMPAQLRGFVDRLDLYRRDGETYVRVVDYKTGRKDFDYCDVLHGLGLQMLLYLFALEDSGRAYLGVSPEAAGVLYFPARAPVLPADGPVEAEQARLLRQKEARRKGLVLADEAVLQAMDAGEESRFLPVKRSKTGALTGDLATEGQLRQLKDYVFRLLARLVDGIAGGQVEPNPYVRGNRDACRFCAYASACHLDLWGEPRVYRAVSAAEFWEQVEKEGKDHG